jgi:hypothetical protein
MPKASNHGSDTENPTGTRDINPEERDSLLKARQDKPAEHEKPPKKGLADAEGPGNQGDAASSPSG